MSKFFTDFQERFDTAFAELHKIVDVLPDEALDWVPMAGMNSTAVLITHLTGAARYWVGDVALGDSSDRVRQLEFEVEGVNTAVLKTRLNDSQTYIQQALSQFSLSDLETMRYMPERDRSFSVGWSLLHALEHMTEHVGHLQILVQLWEVKHDS